MLILPGLTTTVFVIGVLLSTITNTNIKLYKSKIKVAIRYATIFLKPLQTLTRNVKRILSYSITSFVKVLFFAILLLF
jgi:hypothetical protein